MTPWLLLCLFFTPTLSEAAATRQEPARSPEIVAEQIRNFYETNFSKLDIRLQGHFAIRMYRMTGNRRYLETISQYAAEIKEQLAEFVSYLKSPEQIEEAAQKMLPNKLGSPKQRTRRDVLERRLPYVFAAELLFLAYQMHSLGIENQDFKLAVDYLSKFTFRDYLLDPEVITYYPSDAVNNVFYLKYLGIVDLADDYEKKFKAVLMRSEDEESDPIEYENQIYGLTHFVIAASGYYQHFVPREKYAWILDYFESHIQEILDQTKPDLVAEVGLCFKLCRQFSHPVVELAQKYILDAYDSKQGAIPSKKGRVTLSGSEHRNVLAYMLLFDFDRLFPGPQLSN